MTTAERDLLIFIAEALASPWDTTVSGTSWHGERSPKQRLRGLIDDVRFAAATDVSPGATLKLSADR